MPIEQDKETLLDSLYKESVETGKRPSIVGVHMKYLPEWDNDRLLNAAAELENNNDILDMSSGPGYVSLSSTARERASARANPPVRSTIYNIGSVTNSPFQHVESGGHGVQNTQYQIAVNDLRAVIDLYRNHVDELNLDASQRQKADKAVATIEAQLVDDDPDLGIVKAAGQSLKKIVVAAIGGALGNVIANPTNWTLLLSMF